MCNVMDDRVEGSMNAVAGCPDMVTETRGETPLPAHAFQSIYTSLKPRLQKGLLHLQEFVAGFIRKGQEGCMIQQGVTYNAGKGFAQLYLRLDTKRKARLWKVAFAWREDDLS